MLQRTGSLAVSIFLLIAFLWVLSIRDAHAYIDPGSGAFLIQILLASLFASLFSLKMFWGRVVVKISGLLSKLRGSHPNEPQDVEGNP